MRLFLLALTASLVLAIPAGADFASQMNSVSCTGTGVELCFAPVQDLGAVEVPQSAIVEPNITPAGTVATAAIVRLIIVPNALEVPIIGLAAGQGDPCAVYAAAPYPCVTVTTLPVVGMSASPTVDPQVVVLGHAVLGTMTVKVNGVVVAVVPGYVDIVCDSRGLFDADCDGESNQAELTAAGGPSNPFYRLLDAEQQGRRWIVLVRLGRRRLPGRPRNEIVSRHEPLPGVQQPP